MLVLKKYIIFNRNYIYMSKDRSKKENYTRTFFMTLLKYQIGQ